jgi:glycine dehydrogenase subunit 1
MRKESRVHPYIPNSVPEVKQEMLNEIGVRNSEELYAEMIPKRLRLKKPLRLPKPLPSEHDLSRHMAAVLSKNRTCRHPPSFLGGGCWQHFVPAVCDEIAGRSEFLTAYSGENYTDLGRFQAFFEFQSMIGELVGMEVACLSTYDWGASAGFAIRMASRMNGRREILVPRTISPARLSIIRNFAQLPEMPEYIRIVEVGYDRETGMMDLEDLKGKISSRTSSVYFENPSYLGVIESEGDEISKMAHEVGAESVVGVDPISLGLLVPPSSYGADIVCGEVQSLGIHMNCGGGLAGFIASRDEEKYVGEYPTHLVSITKTRGGNGFGFGYCRYERSSYVAREKAKDWVGTATAMWSIVGATYMALMGPRGMQEIGEAIMQKSHYAAEVLSEIRGVRIVFPHFFKEFVANFDRTGKSAGGINKALLRKGLFGGKDITREFPELGGCALYCVTESHTKENIDMLDEAIRRAVR